MILKYASYLLALMTLTAEFAPAQADSQSACIAASPEAVRQLKHGMKAVFERVGTGLRRRVVGGVDFNPSPDGGCSIEVQALIWTGVGKTTLYVRGLTEQNVADKLAEVEALIAYELRDQVTRPQETLEIAGALARSNPSPSTHPRLSDGFGAAAGTGSQSYLSIWIELPAIKSEEENYSDDGIDIRYSWARISLSGGTMGKETVAQVSFTLLERAKYDRSATYGSSGAQVKYGIFRFMTLSGAGVWDRREDARAFSKLFTLSAAEWTGGSGFPLGSARFDGLVSLSAGWQFRGENQRVFLGGLTHLQLTFKNGFFLDIDVTARREYASGSKADPSVTDFSFGLGRQFKNGWVTRAGMTHSDFRTSRKEDPLDICPQCGTYETYDGVNLRPEGWSSDLTILKRF